MKPPSLSSVVSKIDWIVQRYSSSSEKLVVTFVAGFTGLATLFALTKMVGSFRAKHAAKIRPTVTIVGRLGHSYLIPGTQDQEMAKSYSTEYLLMGLSHRFLGNMDNAIFFAALAIAVEPGEFNYLPFFKEKMPPRVFAQLSSELKEIRKAIDEAVEIVNERNKLNMRHILYVF